MFDISWTEILLIAVVAILVVGPRDLPKMLRTVGNFLGQMRRMAGDFQRQFNDAIREAELDDVKRGIDSVRKANPVNQIKDELNPLRKAGEGVRKAIEDPGAPKPAAKAKASSTKPETGSGQPDATTPGEPAKKTAPVKKATGAVAADEPKPSSSTPKEKSAAKAGSSAAG